MNKMIFMLPLLFLLFFMPVHAKGSEEDTWVSEEIQQACIDCGEQYDICPELLLAIIEAESSGQANAVNGECKGLMQISSRWHQNRMVRLGVSDLFDLHGNILVGCDYLSELVKKYEDVGTVLMVYHGERGAESKTELSQYASDILNRSSELEQLHKKEDDEKKKEERKKKKVNIRNTDQSNTRFESDRKMNDAREVTCGGLKDGLIPEKTPMTNRFQERFAPEDFPNDKQNLPVVQDEAIIFGENKRKRDEKNRRSTGKSI